MANCAAPADPQGQRRLDRFSSRDSPSPVPKDGIGGGSGDDPRLQEYGPPDLTNVIDEKWDRDERNESRKDRERQFHV
jgi:hypothetical protein